MNDKSKEIYINAYKILRNDNYKSNIITSKFRKYIFPSLSTVYLWLNNNNLNQTIKKL